MVVRQVLYWRGGEGGNNITSWAPFLSVKLPLVSLLLMTAPVAAGGGVTEGIGTAEAKEWSGIATGV